MKNVITSYSFEQDLAKRLQNPAFRRAWAESEVEYNLACQIIEARLALKLSQQQLAAKVQTSQAAISRIEAMNGNPSLNLLKRIAKSLDMPLSIKLG